MSTTTSIITAVASAIGEFFGWAKVRLGLKNTPVMQANAQAKTDAEIKAEAAKVIAKGDLDQIRKAAAE